MKKQPILFAILLSGCVACNNSSQPDTHDPFCYSGISGLDTVSLSYTRNADSISGELIYMISGKDKNMGKLAGRMVGDTLFAGYTFESEGKTSFREVAFLKKDSTLTEGYGNVAEVDGGMRFSIPRQLDFSKGIILKMSPCN